MESFKVENLSFVYPDRCDKALENISFTVNRGEFVLLCGKSGCGKTTLLRLLKSALAPFGKMSGNILFNGKPLAACDVKEQAAGIGFVMQSPENQIVTDKVWHEIAFGLESLGYETAEIRTRVSEMASFFGIQTWFYKNTSELSGGQKQLLNLAAVMVMQPSVLILDEPVSQLDPIAAGEFIKTVERINRELGTTVILAEHRLEDVFPVADRVIVMDNGKIIANDTPAEAGKILKSLGHDMYKALPTPMRVCCEVENTLSCPLTVRDGRVWLEEYSKENTLNSAVIPKDALYDSSDTVIEVRDAWFRYSKEMPDALKGLDFTVKKGELFCLLGGNAAGKTTALSIISGINTPYRGEVRIKGQAVTKIKNLYNGLLGVIPQNPHSVFAAKTVYLDLMDVLTDRRLSEEDRERRLMEAAVLCRIENVLQSHPYDLSGGELQRAALAKILLIQPELLLLDEPTKGMDAQFKEELADILADLKASGVTVLMVSHDIEFCAEYADRCALVFDGSITSQGTPREFFKGKNFYTTAANRMARTTLPDAVLAEDIILACGGRAEKKKRQIRHAELQKTGNEIKHGSETTIAAPRSGRRLTKRAVLSTLMTLLLIPLTIYIGVCFFGDRKYYFISLLIILEAMLSFGAAFESRKPKARELVVIGVLCAIAVAGRAAFSMIPAFKPVAALVIITGVCFGAEAGFLSGCITAFASNFIFGQGPWTPWQMFALGIVGFIAGILFKNGFLRKSKIYMCVFGFLAVIVIYGGIMNSASVIMSQSKITWEMLVLSCTMGFPFDLIHALSTVFFLWLISKPMTEKLERVKIKYGLITNE